ncbi:unnamed protein product [Camellia sinensis]
MGRCVRVVGKMGLFCCGIWLRERSFTHTIRVLQLRAPIKIFGDLHGQFGDLMRLFDEYGSPSTAGDIAYIDYLFLGDYVDRGQHSLETITLLLSLKVLFWNSEVCPVVFKLNSS